MKKILLLLVAVFAFQFSQAQHRLSLDKATPQMEQKAEKESKMLTKELALNGKQPLLVKNKLLEFEVKKDEILNSGLSKKEMRANLKALKVNRLKEMQDILTQPQYDQLLIVEKEMRNKRAQKMVKKKEASKH
jgi:hypothetical protein